MGFKVFIMGFVFMGMWNSSFACSSSSKTLGSHIHGECEGVKSCKGEGGCNKKGHLCSENNACKKKGASVSTNKNCPRETGTL